MNEDVRTEASSGSHGTGNGRRWLAAGIIPAAVIAIAVAVPAVADPTPTLPEKSAQEVLELVAQSGDATYSGTVEQTSELGLPELPAMGPDSSSDSPAGSALELLTGTHSARVFVGSEDTARFQVMDTLAQRDVVINGSDVWLYSSASKEAVHVLLPEDTLRPDDAAVAPDETILPDGVPEGPPTTPAELAEQLLETIEPSTTIEVSDTARVAGRSAYTVTLTPNTDDTLVASVVLSVDSETGLPLAVSVAAAGQDAAAFSVEFSSISFETPDADLFAFVPPADATVTEKDLTDVAQHHADGIAPDGTAPDGTVPDGTAPDNAEDSARPEVVGEGWASIVVIPAEVTVGDEGDAGDESTEGDVGDAAEAQQLLEQFTTEVPEGRLFESALVSVLLTTDGRILIGAVSGEQLQSAAQSTP